jgi:hypothetical protein
MADGNDAIGVHLAALVDRDIFTCEKMFVRKVKADIVGQGAAVVMKGPSAALAMNETAVLVPPVRPQSRDPARLAMRASEARIDAAVDVERRNDSVGEAVLAVRVIGFTGELDTELPELRRQRAVQDRPGLCFGHRRIAPC